MKVIEAQENYKRAKYLPKKGQGGAILGQEGATPIRGTRILTHYFGRQEPDTLRLAESGHGFELVETTGRRSVLLPRREIFLSETIYEGLNSTFPQRTAVLYQSDQYGLSMNAMAAEMKFGPQNSAEGGHNGITFKYLYDEDDRNNEPTLQANAVIGIGFVDAQETTLLFPSKIESDLVVKLSSGRIAMRDLSQLVGLVRIAYQTGHDDDI